MIKLNYTKAQIGEMKLMHLGTEKFATTGMGALIQDWLTMHAEIERLTKLTYCAYCGMEFLLDDEAATNVSEHIKTCEKHPMRLVEAELTRLNNAIEGAMGEIEKEKDTPINYFKMGISQALYILRKHLGVKDG